jgi:2-dehydro-3-deoxyphosphogalactonate aldolase
VLPPGTPLWPVGGVTPAQIGAWVAAGATGAGLGSQLYAPGLAPGQVAQRAFEFAAAWRAGAAS